MIHRKQEAAPNRLVFVLHKDNSWLNNGGGDFSIPLKPPSTLIFWGRDQPAMTAKTSISRALVFSVPIIQALMTSKARS